MTQAGFDFGVNGGGNRDMATAYMARWGGPVLETDDPYPNPPTSANIVTLGSKPANRHVQEVLYIPARTNSVDNDNLKSAVTQYGAVDTSMYYADAYYNSTTKAYYDMGNTGVNHDVAIVGWDDNYPRANFNGGAPGDGAFIIRNNWGTQWGENGYFYVSYYDKALGNSENAVFENAEDTRNYKNEYQYDPLGMTSTIGYGDTVGWFANIFTAGAKEKLGAASFYTTQLNAVYEIYVESNYDANGFNNISQTNNKVASGTIPIPGYHTIKLPTPVSLTDNHKFVLAVKIVNPVSGYPIPVEMPIKGYSGQASAHTGESFSSRDGSTWLDLQSSSYTKNANVCLKAFTVNGPVIAVQNPPGGIATVLNAVYNYDVSFSVIDTVGIQLPIVTANGSSASATDDGGGNYHTSVALNTGNNTIVLSDTNDNGDTSSQIVTIVRAETSQLDQLQFGAASYTAVEGSNVVIDVQRSGSGVGAVSVAYETDSSGSATTADYTPVSGTLNFADGEMVKTFSVLILSDNKQDPNETIGLVLSSPGGTVLGSQSTALITIKEGLTKLVSDLPKTSFDMAPGTSLPVHIAAVFADGSTGDVTNSITWKNNKPTVAGFSDGSLTANSATTGAATLKGTYLSKTISITVNSTIKSFTLTGNGTTKNIAGKTVNSRPEASMGFGLSANFGKDAASNGISLDITNLADWAANKSDATVVKGLVNLGSTPEVTKITASYLGKTSSVTIDTSLKSLSVSQSSSTTNLKGKKIKSKPGAEIDFALTANYGNDAAGQPMTEDITSAASWSSSKTSSTVQAGQVTNTSTPGTAVITASYAGKKISFTVDTTVSSLALYNTNDLTTNLNSKKLDFKPGAVSNYVIIATCGKDANGTDLTVDVSAWAAWSSSNSGIAGMTVVGNVYQIGTVTDAYGLATVKASYGGKSVSLRVNSVRNDLSPAPVALNMVDITGPQLLLNAPIADSSSGEVTSQAVWTTGGGAAPIKPGDGPITAIAKGNRVITARLGARSELVNASIK